MISWLITNSMAPAANPSPQGNRLAEALTTAAPSTAPRGSTRPEAMPSPTAVTLHEAYAALVADRPQLQRFAERAWHSRQLAFALIAEPVEPEVDERRLRYREAYAALFTELLEAGNRLGQFQVGQVNLIAACLVGAIAEALVGPLSPPARAAREAGYPAPSLAEVSQALVTFCLRAVGAPLPAEEPQP